MGLVIAGRAYIGGAIRRTGIVVNGGRITSINADVGQCADVDVGDALIFPAAIDAHVHFRDPGSTQKEDFFTGTKAAALGGVTAIIDMPNTRPSASNTTLLKKKIQAVKNKACVDFGLYGGIGPESDIAGMAQYSTAFKTYLSGDNDMYVPPDLWPNILTAVKETEKLLAIHAELRDCLDLTPSHSLKEHADRRPIACEKAAVEEVLRANKNIGTPLHFCHVSSSTILDMVEGQRSVTTGVTPHHMLLSYDHPFLSPALGKVNPPLRSEGERQALQRKFIEGVPSLVESDHAPHKLDEKNEFSSAPSGLPGVDTLLPLLLYQVKLKKVPLSLVHRMVCAAPAARFGLNKGHIAPGKDADLIVVDFHDQPIASHSKCGWTPYEGMMGVYPTHVFLRGRPIVDQGMFIGTAGQGELIP
jgi:dihydroorotase